MSENFSNRAGTADLLAAWRQGPVVATLKNDEACEAVLSCRGNTVAVLFGDVTSITDTVIRLKEAGKNVLVNIDMVEGYGPKAASVKDLCRRAPVDGIMSSKVPLVRAAKDNGIVAIHRLFMVDSFAYHQAQTLVRNSQADFIELLPGCVPRVIEWIRADIDKPVIAGGLVCNLDDVKAALLAGASAVATSDQALWNLAPRS